MSFGAETCGCSISQTPSLSRQREKTTPGKRGRRADELFLENRPHEPNLIPQYFNEEVKPNPRMPPQKTTKIQKLTNGQIMTWLRDRDIKDIPVREVLEKYLPPDIKTSGQYFTSIEMGTEALEKLRLRLPSPPMKLRILDPCAGIGHLVYLVSFLRPIICFDAYEIETECVEIGRKLFSWVCWFAQMPFVVMSDVEGKYDLVLCNPPIGIKRGMDLGKMMSETHCSRSEHIFLELSIRALKPGGQAVILGPVSYMDSRPARLKTWMDERVIITSRLGPLPGSNQYSKVPLYAYYLTRKGGDTSGDEASQRLSLSQIGSVLMKNSAAPGSAPPHPDSTPLTIFPNGDDLSSCPLQTRRPSLLV